MSGNPFRASLVPKHPAAPATVPPTSFINAESSSSPQARDERESDSVPDDVASAFPAKTKKSVRIESPTETAPPHSGFHDADDALSQRINRSRYADSPPPMSPAGFSDNFEDTAEGDPFEEDSGSAEMDTRGMTGASRRNPGQPEAVHSPVGTPANPFSRTLATIEPHEKGSAELAGQKQDRTTTERTTPGHTKASLDVEGFKNLLMTGIQSPRSSGPPPQGAAAPNPISASVFESSSSTDTSSVSRQSIFEPVQELHIESPRTSYDMAASDDDRISLMGEIKKEKKKPPPAPKHRHGKMVSMRAPQTVSFEAFIATESTKSPPSSRNRTNSDLNKPLPPTPSVVSPPPHIISQDITLDLPSIPDTKAGETASLSDVAPAQKRIPPPVPIARRQSQLRNSTVGNRSRSNSSLTMSSQHSADGPILSPGYTSEPASSPSSQKAPPPPPPARRHGAALAAISTSSANSSLTELSSNVTATARRPTVTSPNPSSSRRTTFSDPPSPSPGLARTSSINSTRNAPRSVSNESASMPPPPPPPPRRRQSGRSSPDKERPSLPLTSPTESRRTSTEYKRNSIDSKRRTSAASESSLKYEYAPAAESEPVLYSPKEEAEDSVTYNIEEVKINSNTILDDMERFQREIDELREKYKKAA